MKKLLNIYCYYLLTFFCLVGNISIIKASNITLEQWIKRSVTKIKYQIDKNEFNVKHGLSSHNNFLIILDDGDWGDNVDNLRIRKNIGKDKITETDWKVLNENLKKANASGIESYLIVINYLPFTIDKADLDKETVRSLLSSATPDDSQQSALQARKDFDSIFSRLIGETINGQTGKKYFCGMANYYAAKVKNQTNQRFSVYSNQKTAALKEDFLKNIQNIIKNSILYGLNWSGTNTSRAQNFIKAITRSTCDYPEKNPDYNCEGNLNSSNTESWVTLSPQQGSELQKLYEKYGKNAPNKITTPLSDNKTYVFDFANVIDEDTKNKIIRRFSAIQNSCEQGAVKMISKVIFTDDRVEKKDRETIEKYTKNVTGNEIVLWINFDAKGVQYKYFGANGMFLRKDEKSITGWAMKYLENPVSVVADYYYDIAEVLDFIGGAIGALKIPERFYDKEHKDCNGIGDYNAFMYVIFKYSQFQVLAGAKVLELLKLNTSFVEVDTELAWAFICGFYNEGIGLIQALPTSASGIIKFVLDIQKAPDKISEFITAIEKLIEQCAAEYPTYAIISLYPNSAAALPARCAWGAIVNHFTSGNKYQIAAKCGGAIFQVVTIVVSWLKIGKAAVILEAIEAIDAFSLLLKGSGLIVKTVLVQGKRLVSFGRGAIKMLKNTDKLLFEIVDDAGNVIKKENLTDIQLKDAATEYACKHYSNNITESNTIKTWLKDADGNIITDADGYAHAQLDNGEMVLAKIGVDISDNLKNFLKVEGITDIFIPGIANFVKKTNDFSLRLTKLGNNLSGSEQFIEEIVKAQKSAKAIDDLSIKSLGNVLDDIEYVVINYGDKNDIVKYFNEMIAQEEKFKAGTVGLEIIRNPPPYLQGHTLEGLELRLFEEVEDGKNRLDLLFKNSEQRNIYIDTKNYSNLYKIFDGDNVSQLKAYFKKINNMDELFIVIQKRKGFPADPLKSLKNKLQEVYKANDYEFFDTIWENENLRSNLWDDIPDEIDATTKPIYKQKFKTMADNNDNLLYQIIKINE